MSAEPMSPGMRVMIAMGVFVVLAGLVLYIFVVKPSQSSQSGEKAKPKATVGRLLHFLPPSQTA